MIDKNKLLSNLKQDFEEAKKAKSLIEEKIIKWKKYYNAEPLGNEVQGKSRYISRDIKKLLKYQLPLILEPFVSTPEIVRCQGTTAESVQTAKSKEKLLNYLFCRNFDRYNFLKKAIKLAQREGVCVVQTGWFFQQNEDGTYVNEPTAKIIKFEDVFIDPTADGENPEFVIIRYKTTLSNLRENKAFYNQKNVEALAQKLIAEKEQESGSISYDNLDDSSLKAERISDINFYNGDNNFKSTDVSRQKVEVYEFWGKYDINEDGIAENIVCCWANDTILKLEDNPYPDDEIPFVIFNYEPEPFFNVGDSAIEDLYDKSHLITIMTRGLIENVANANAGQIGIANGALDSENMERFLKGKNFLFNRQFGSEIWRNDYNPLGTAPLELIRMFNDENEMLSGINKITMGSNSKVLSATQSSQLENASQRRLGDLVRNIAENLVKPILKKWLSYCAEFLNEQEVYYITNDEYFVLQKKELYGNTHLIMQVTTQAVDEEKARQLSFLLQTSSQSLDPNISKMLYSKLLKLNRLYEEAKELEEYQPPVDEFGELNRQLEIQKQQLELEKLKVEIEKIKSEIAENYSQVEQAKFEIQDKMQENPHKRELDKIAMQNFAKS